MFIGQGLKPGLLMRPYGTAKARALIRTCVWTLAGTFFLLTLFVKPCAATRCFAVGDIQATSSVAPQDPQSGAPAAAPQPSLPVGMRPPSELSIASPAQQSSAMAAQLPNPYDEIVVTAVGDVMLGTTFPDDSTLPPNDGAGLLAEVTPFLKRGDVVFGNL